MTATETQPKPFFPALAEDPRWTFVGTPAEYRTLAAKVRDYDVARETMYPGQHSFTPEELAAIGLPKPTNEERSAVEEYEFRTNKEERYFAYVNQETKTVTTWTGQPLGVILALTGAYRSNFGDARLVYRVIGSNGVVYSAVYYCSAGSYCRMRARVRRGEIVMATAAEMNEARLRVGLLVV
jgi:hypothetical protein